MEKNPQLSILLAFQNERKEVEPVLEALFELSSVNFELFIIDDASTDGTGQAIHTLLDYYGHKKTFFFEHTKPAGRGNCLNELLRQVNTNIIWAPHSLNNVDEAILEKSIKTLSISEKPSIVQQFTIPGNNEEWLHFIEKDPFPVDAHFLWNLNNIPPTDHFFNPWLNRFFSLEWVIRLSNNDILSTDQKFCRLTKGIKTPSSFERQEIVTSLLKRSDLSDDYRRKIISFLQKLPKAKQKKSDAEVEQNILEEAIRLKDEGQLKAALESIEEILKKGTDNNRAKQLKVEILEKKRQFVEASELKHELNTEGKAQIVHPQISKNKIKTSLIIPTALHGKPALEHCLLSVAEYCDPATTELIIIDNASLDDTYDYLEELEEKNFFNCKIISNEYNKGFAASANQGFEIASGDYYCLLHNDVEFENRTIFQLEKLMDNNPEFALLGPLADSTLNSEQLIGNKTEDRGIIEETEYLDSFLMMIRAKAGIKMDEKYTLAFFDDIDFSFQIRDAGHKVGIARGVSVNHHYGNTTFALNLDTESRLYWQNISIFNKKWAIESISNEQLKDKSALDQLLLLNEWVNPLYPEPDIVEKFEQLFTSELKTQILEDELEQETLQQLTHLFMVMDKRDIMRRLEDRLTKPKLPVTFIYELVRFYYDKNIYSRCLHYLDRLTAQQQSLQSKMYELAILIDEKR